MTLINVLVSVIFTLQLSGQTVLLDHPKDIVYEQIRECFYITNNTGNNVVVMDSAGNFSELLDSIPNPMGLALLNDTLIISSSSPATVIINNLQAETAFQSNCFLNKGLNHLEIPVSGLMP